MSPNGRPRLWIILAHVRGDAKIERLDELDVTLDRNPPQVLEQLATLLNEQLQASPRVQVIAIPLHVLRQVRHARRQNGD